VFRSSGHLRLAALLAAANLAGQIERTTVRLVEVSVIAEDKKGNSVGDLKREDFTVFDQRRAERITAFSVEPGAGMPPPEPAPPNTFSNRVDRMAGGSVTAVLFDGLNTRIADQSYARDQILRFLGQVRQEDRVALYALGRGLNVLQEFTNDPELLRAALRRKLSALQYNERSWLSSQR
jgi:VWFA-related protein